MCDGWLCCLRPCRQPTCIQLPLPCPITWVVRAAINVANSFKISTHRRPTSLIHFPSLMSVMICWAIGRMIASSFDWMRGMLGIYFLRFDRSYSASWVSRPRVLRVQQLLIDCARYQRMIVRTRSSPMQCTLRRRHFGRIIIGKVPCDDICHSFSKWFKILRCQVWHLCRDVLVIFRWHVYDISYFCLARKCSRQVTPFQ